MTRVAPQVLTKSRYAYAADMVAELAPSLPCPDVLDVGAGDAPMREPVERTGLRWRGFDLDSRQAGVARWNLELPCPVAGIAAGMVLMLDVIEHLRNPGIALRHAADALAPGGWLLVTTPNPRWSVSRIYALRTGFQACFTQADLDGNHHLIPVWPHVLERLLSDEGLRVERYATLDGPTSWPRGPLSLRLPLRLAHAAFAAAIEAWDASACGMSYAMLARKGS